MRNEFQSMLVTALLLFLSAAPSRAELGAGDQAWATRAEGLDEERARPEGIESAISQYKTAIEADPGSIEARWKLLRAYQYAVDFTTLSEDQKDARVREAVGVARASVTLLESGVGSDADRARLLFWSSIAWGTRAQRVGLLTIVREGAASRMHEYAQRSLDLDPSVDGGGALRLLSRLHSTLPRVPFVSGWVDRDQVVPLAERGYALAAEHPGNRLVLALALLEHAPERQSEAGDLLRSVATAEPRPGFRAEDLAIRKQASERLAALRAEAGGS